MGFKNTEGTFYTDSSKIIVSGFFILQSNFWVCTNTYESYFNLYLDRNKKIINPKNEDDKDHFCKKVLDLIFHYEKIIKDYNRSGNFKKVSPSYDMGQAIANSYLIEYRKIYIDHFASLALKYIFED